MPNYTFVTLASDFATNSGFGAFSELPDVANNNNQMVVDNKLYSSGKFTYLEIGTYQVKFGGTVMLESEGTYATSINNKQEIVGVYDYNSGNISGQFDPFNGSARSFILQKGVYTSFDEPQALKPGGGSYGTYASGVNDPGQIVGFYLDANSLAHGFLYVGGNFSTLDDPQGAGGTYARSINNAGQVVGYYIDANRLAHGFVDSGGTFTPLDDALGTGGTYATGVNNLGQIVGYYVDGSGATHGFVYGNGGFTTLDAPLSAPLFMPPNGTDAQSINDQGQILGAYTDSTGALHSYRAEIIAPTGATSVFDNSWGLIGIGDVNGGGFSDLVWKNQMTNAVEVEFVAAVAGAGGFIDTVGGGTIGGGPFDASWSPVTVGDFNGDGLSDLVYRRTSDGLTEIQFLKGNTAIGGGAIASNPFDASWNIVGVGNFSGSYLPGGVFISDGRSGLVWQRPSDGLVEIQYLNGNNAVGGGEISNNPFGLGWNVVGVGDFNGDGASDLVWQRASDALVEIQLLNGATPVGGGAINNSPFGAGWNVVGTGDFNGDGQSDLVYQRQSDGLVEIQFLNGIKPIGGGAISNSPFGPGWQVVGVGDFNGDGKADLVYRNMATGTTEVQLLDGLTPIGGGVIAFG